MLSSKVHDIHGYNVLFLLLNACCYKGADWLQGPYLYKLYQSYGFELVQIAFLFLTGFASGALGGTAVGSLADSW